MNPHYKFASFFTKNSQYQEWLTQLSEKIVEGHVCLDLENSSVKNIEAKKLKASKYSNVNDSISSLFQQDASKALSNDNEVPFVIHNQKLYTQRYFSYESKLLDGIKSIIAQEDVENMMQRILADDRMRELVAQLFPKPLQHETDFQMVACVTAFLHRFFIITGGPGTGKTTTLSKLLELFLADNPDASIAIAAPTGKAASRLKDSLSQEYHDTALVKSQVIKDLVPTTIHKLLGINPHRVTPKKNKVEKLDIDILVIDESSMIDIVLFTQLIDALDVRRTKLILLGDRNQLASVDAGSLFGDLCLSVPMINAFEEDFIAYFKHFDINTNDIELNDNSEQNVLQQHLVELKKSYRNMGAISELSHAVINSQVGQSLSIMKGNNTNVTYIDIADDHAVSACIQSYIESLKEAFDDTFPIDDKLNNINRNKILTATKQGKYGVVSINHMVQQALNETNGTFYQNQLLMVTKNQNEILLSNGDIGMIQRDNNQVFKAYFPIYTQESTEPLSIIPTNIHEWEEAYAMTIHKSQGSEFDHVIVIIPPAIGAEHNFLTRELLYTGITRAKHKATIIADEATISSIIASKVNRVSGIKERWDEPSFFSNNN